MVEMSDIPDHFAVSPSSRPSPSALVVTPGIGFEVSPLASPPPMVSGHSAPPSNFPTPAHSRVGTPMAGEATFAPPPLVRKRPGEDLTQFAAQVGRAAKFPKTLFDKLTNFSKLSSGEREVQLYAELLKISNYEEENKEIRDMTKYIIPKTMMSLIGTFTFRALLNPSRANYLDTRGNHGPDQDVMVMLLGDSRSGYTSTIAADPNKFPVIRAYICNKLNQRRYMLKKSIVQSMTSPFLDIISLTQQVISLNVGAAVGLSVQLCTRMAFLRWATKRAPDNDKEYWKYINTELGKVCQRSYVWQKELVIKEDQELYGAIGDALDHMKPADIHSEEDLELGVETEPDLGED